MAEFEIQFESGAVQVEIAPGKLDAMLGRHASCSEAHGFAIIADENVAKLFGRRCIEAIGGASKKSALIKHAPGEPAKNLKTVDCIYRGMFKASADRSWEAIAIGGGVTGDLAGFAASTYMRGIPYVQVPTTLLAQADSCIGGKVGVNHPKAGKNMIGLFSQPVKVIIDPATVLSMPRREFLSGFAEIIKHGIIMDGDFFSEIERRAKGLASGNVEYLASAVERSVRIKAGIAAGDEMERGKRALLNLGHTIGHAIEASSPPGAVLHGEAVSVGICAAAILGRKYAGLDAADMKRIGKALGKFSLPVSWPRAADPARAAAAIARDKKFRHGKARIVLPECIGRARIVEDFPLQELIGFVRDFSVSG